MQRGFVLQPTYRVEAGRAVVQLYGKLEQGGSFLIRETRQRPCFHVRQADADRAVALGARLVPDSIPRVDFQGRAVARIELSLPNDIPALRDRLTGRGIATYEADVRFPYRYLIDHGIRGAIGIHGESRPGDGVDAVFDDPRVEAVNWSPTLSALSIDIETDPTIQRLLAVALEGCGASEVLLLTPPGYSCPEGAIACGSEAELLRRLVARVRELDPDVITGWNVIGFDLDVLCRMAERERVPLTLGRGSESVRVRRQGESRGPAQASVQGRAVLDGIQLLRGSFVQLDSYALNAASREILGRGKTIVGHERADQILEAWESEREQFVEYNLNDARLVLEILDELKLLELTVERSRLTGMPPDRVAASIASFDLLYLSALGPRGIVAPSVTGSDLPGPPSTGGHVMEPEAGLHRNVLILDFKSLYPSIIRTFQIDPLGLVSDPTEDGRLIVAPNGARFRREPGILPSLLDDLYPRREAAKRAGKGVASQAIKILMNSFYGVLGTRACRFATPELPNAITGFGRELLLWSRDRIEAMGHRVLYGDTDSLFVLAGVEEAGEARKLAGRIVEALNADLARHIQDGWDVESRLELEFEKLYLRLLLPPARHGTAGARKRYVGLLDGDPPQVQFTGMESVRRDWTDLAKQVQRELYERLFHDRPVEEYLARIVRELRAGELDDRLVYRKALRKRLSSYTAQTPPHVAAARKMKGRPGRLIRYVITVAGPEPADERQHPLDREHYVRKQIEPIAEPVLGLLDLDFARVVGDDRQLPLF